MTRTCAWCGARDAIKLDEDSLPICGKCARPVGTPDFPPSFADRVLLMIQRIPGMDLPQLGDAFAMTGREDRNHLSVVVSRHIRLGRIRSAGSLTTRRYYAITTTRRSARARLADPHLDSARRRA